MILELLLDVWALFSILNFGAVGDGKTDNTVAINQAIEKAASSKHHAIVEVPAGTYITGTIHMKSHVTLRLHSGAVLKGTDDLKAYEPLKPISDLSRYESGRGTVNANSAYDPVWSQSLIQMVGVGDAHITGQGTIDGSHVFNPNGEEHQRGPHTILIADSKFVTLNGIHIKRSSNYAILAYNIEYASFSKLRIDEGWDGIHIRGGRNVEIDDCELHTGDDGIAGGYWDHMKIRNCQINSSCNGIRMIQPSTNLLVEHCRFYGPGLYAHRTSGNKNSLAAISLEPGGWGPAPGRLDKIPLRHLDIDQVNSPLSVTLSDDNRLGRLKISDVNARDITRMALSVKSWGSARSEKVTLKNVTMNFRGIDDPQLPAWFKDQPTSKWPVFPSYALYFRNVDRVDMRNVKCDFSGNEYREPIIYDNVKSHTEKRVHCKKMQSND